MIDREKVITSLEQCTDTTGHRVDCYGCIYQNITVLLNRPGMMCRDRLMRDALELLRADKREEDDGK